MRGSVSDGSLSTPKSTGGSNTPNESFDDSTTQWASN